MYIAWRGAGPVDGTCCISNISLSGLMQSEQSRGKVRTG
jgi:hypothetical protein